MNPPGFPVMLDLVGVPVLVVGAGRVAGRKVPELVEAGAALRVVAPAAEAGIEALAAAGALELVRREARVEDLAGVRLAFLATPSGAVNDRLEAGAKARGVLVTRADRPGGGDFAGMARIRRGPITVAVSTGGASPRLAKLLRERLESVLDEGWERAVESLAALREGLPGHLPDPEARRRFWEVFPDPAALAALLAGESSKVEREVTRCLSTLSA